MFSSFLHFDGPCVQLNISCPGIIGGIVSSIAWALGVGTFILGAALWIGRVDRVFSLLIGLAAMIASIWFSLAQGVKRLCTTTKIQLADFVVLCAYHWLDFALYMLFADGWEW